jgi:hypothetical protein
MVKQVQYHRQVAASSLATMIWGSEAHVRVDRPRKREKTAATFKSTYILHAIRQACGEAAGESSSGVPAGPRPSDRHVLQVSCMARMGTEHHQHIAEIDVATVQSPNSQQSCRDHADATNSTAESHSDLPGQDERGLKMICRHRRSRRAVARHHGSIA